MGNVKFYSPLEEKINVISHFIGLIMSVLALCFLIATSLDSYWRLISFSVFGICLILLYAASTLYHASRDIEVRKKRRIWDHCAIYLLIAGTYTPYTLVTLQGETGWILFVVNWSMALGGILLKLFFTGSAYKHVSFQRQNIHFTCYECGRCIDIFIKVMFIHRFSILKCDVIESTICVQIKNTAAV